MNCDCVEVPAGLICRHCQKLCDGPRECPRWQPPQVAELTDAERAELFPDPTLIGNRLAALTTALGIPPCGGCGQRQEWLNRAHVWLRDHV